MVLNIQDSVIPTNVLVIEDDGDDFLILEEMLHGGAKEDWNLKLNIQQATGYEEAVMMAGDQEWDLFIADYVLAGSGQTGLDFINAMFRRGSEVPAFMITGHTGLDFRPVDFKTLGERNLRIIAKKNLSWEILKQNILDVVEKRGVIQKNTKVTSILVVEDDEEDYEILSDVFKQHPEMPFELPFCLVQVADYENAMRLLVGTNWDLCILDYQLNDSKTGLDIVHEMRKRNLKSPVMIVSGYRGIPFNEEDKKAIASKELMRLSKSELDFEAVLKMLEGRPGVIVGLG